jgi:hypothetical protein
VRPVQVANRVLADFADAVSHDRAVLGNIVLDLQTNLPNNLAHYQSKRVGRSQRCFYYERTYSLDPHSFKLRRLRFVVRDSDPSMLEVIWVVVVA